MDLEDYFDELQRAVQTNNDDDGTTPNDVTFFSNIMKNVQKNNRKTVNEAKDLIIAELSIRVEKLNVHEPGVKQSVYFAVAFVYYLKQKWTNSSLRKLMKQTKYTLNSTILY